MGVKSWLNGFGSNSQTMSDAGHRGVQIGKSGFFIRSLDGDHGHLDSLTLCGFLFCWSWEFGVCFASLYLHSTIYLVQYILRSFTFQSHKNCCIVVPIMSRLVSYLMPQTKPHKKARDYPSSITLPPISEFVTSTNTFASPTFPTRHIRIREG